MNGAVVARGAEAEPPLSHAQEPEAMAEPVAGSSQFVNALRRFGAFDDD